MVSFEDMKLEEGSPIYLQIIHHLKMGIAAGTVQDGEELPSRRTLSALLGVNPNTIQKAFHILEEEGLIVSHVGAKSCVSVTREQVQCLEQQLPDAHARQFIKQMQAMGLSCTQVVGLVERLWEEEV